MTKATAPAKSPPKPQKVVGPKSRLHKPGKGRKPKTGLLVPHVRVLRALQRARGRPLTRVQLAERAGFSSISGTINRALAGIAKDSPQVKRHGRPHKGLLGLGLVKAHHVVDKTAGVNEWVYEMTKEGEKALDTFEGTIGDVRQRKTCINTRYVKAQEREKAKRQREREKKAAAKQESNGQKKSKEEDEGANAAT